MKIRSIVTLSLFFLCFEWLAGVAVWSETARGDDPPPLWTRIDDCIESQSGGMTAPLASDAEFLRRVSLDLTGMPPTREDLRDFLDDSSPNKREEAIDRLLESPHYARHMAQTFDVMLMERRPATQTSEEEWQAYLLNSFRENKPFNQLAREILTADGFEPATRAVARFYLDRELEPNAIARDVGRIFFGQDLQCAQCHDHPLVDDYHQKDYQGLYSFFEPGFSVVLKKEGDKEILAYGERAGGDREFESVFVKGKKRLTKPRLPGEMEIEEPTYYPGDEYEVKPGGATRPVPKFSRRAKLAELAAGGANRAFNENIANRLWAHMMGRGLVHPPDWRHSGNPPAYPELLAMLGEEFASMGFDVKRFLRTLALTRTYQRSLDVPSDVVAQSRRAAELLAHLESVREPLAKELEESQAAYESSTEAWSQAEETLIPAVGELNAARAKAEEAAKKVAEAEKATSEAKASLEGKVSVAQPLVEAAAKIQQAAEKLKEDKELVEAAAKIVEKAGRMQGEVETLRKAVEEKSAALEGSMGEMSTARQAMDEVVQAKVAPIVQTERTAEQAAIDARRRYTSAATKLIGLDKRIEKVRQFARLAELDDAAGASEGLVAAAESAVASAQAELARFADEIRACEARISAAQAEKQAALAAHQLVAAEHERRASLAASIRSACETVELALNGSPGDPALTEAAGKLRAKADAFAVETEELRPDLESSLAAVQACEQTLAQANEALAAARAEESRLAEAVSAAERARDAARDKARVDRAAVHEEAAKLAEAWAADFTIAALKPLTAEQICWSVLRVSGVEAQYRAAAAAELDKESPLPEGAANDPAQLAARARDVEQRTYDKLKGNVGAFVRVFAAGAGQPQGDFFATADQALFVANGPSVNAWIAPAGGNVTERIAQAQDAAAAAADLYETVLNRPPTAEEIADVAKRLSVDPSEKGAAARELVWGLVTSAEFRFNH
jgi:hypothetical protein